MEFTVPVFAETTVTGKGWNLNNSVLTIEKNYSRYSEGSIGSGYGWYKYDDEIEKGIVNNGVTELSYSMFSNLKYLTDVSLPNTLKIIDKHVFYGDYNLKIINLPDSIESVGYDAFKGVGVETIVLPSAEYGDESFYSCNNLKNVTIKSGAILGYHMFANCKRLNSVVMQDGISSMPSLIFGNPSVGTCPNLHYLKLSKDIEYNSNAIDKFSVNDDMVIAGPKGTNVEKYANALGKNFYDTSINAVPVSNFITCNDEQYYFDENGYMVFGTQVIDGKTYNFGTNGKLEKGRWILTNNKCWYRHPDGGYTTSDFEKINGETYYFDSEGYMITDWRFINNTWYYFGPSGNMLNGWQLINNKWYYFESNGEMVSNRWIGDYYLTSSGEMAANQWIGNYWCGNDGRYVKNAWVDNNQYYVGSDGSYVPGKWQKDAYGWWYQVGNTYAKNITLHLSGIAYKFNNYGYWID